MPPSPFQNRVFLILLILVTVAFGAILWQFNGAVFWGLVLVILFAPLHRKLLRRMPKSPNLAALATLSLCLVIVILPMALITVNLVQEATGIYDRLKSGQLNFGQYLQQIIAALPAWATSNANAVEVWKDPQCGCCADWIAHMQAEGFRVTVHESGNTAVRARLGLPARLGSCHTALAGGYLIEGHVPAADVKIDKIDHRVEADSVDNVTKRTANDCTNRQR